MWGTHRGAPDVALVANPLSGAWVYDSIPYGAHPPFWLVVGGTSLASRRSPPLPTPPPRSGSPALAELRLIYANRGKAATFTDVTGACANAASRCCCIRL